MNHEVGKSIMAAGLATNYHDQGCGFPVILIHGSGPGVSGWANWRANIAELAKRRRVLALDLTGFGYTEKPGSGSYDKQLWVRHLIGFMDALQIDMADFVGNSFGGGLALSLAISHQDRVRRLILMGSVGVSFPFTEGLDKVWGYAPSFENMRALLDIFVYDRNLVTDELAELRYKASIQPGSHEAFSSMFPSPRQRWVDALACSENDIASISTPTLIVHGREDRVIPVESSLRLFNLMQNAEIHLFGRCGHWTQIEHVGRFNCLVDDFLT